MKIGTYLRKLRDGKGLTTRQIAERTGVSHSTYMDWEHDKSSPSLKSYIRLADAFDTCPVELMGYLTGKISKPLSHEEKMSMAEMREMVAYYKTHTDLLQENNERVERELAKVQELIKERATPRRGI